MLEEIVKDSGGHILDSNLVKILPSRAVELVREEMKRREFVCEIQYGMPVVICYSELNPPRFDDEEKELEYLNRCLRPWEKEPKVSLLERASIWCGLKEKKEYIRTVPYEYDLTLTFIGPEGLTHKEKVFVHCQTGAIRESPYYIGGSWKQISPQYVQKHFEHQTLYHIHIIVDNQQVRDRISQYIRENEKVCSMECGSQRVEKEDLL